MRFSYPSSHSQDTRHFCEVTHAGWSNTKPINGLCSQERNSKGERADTALGLDILVVLAINYS